MENPSPKKDSPLPDITGISSSKPYLPLERVGMSGIETMVHLEEEGEKDLPARANIFVDLIDTQARGIHMSRIYQTLFKELPNHPLTPKLLHRILRECVTSQQGISSQAYIRLSFTLPLINSSLLTGHHGFRHYPIVWEGRYALNEDVFVFHHNFQLLYSSTCPCSTALSEDLQRKNVKTTQLVATPHAQRSVADITLGFHHLPDKNFMANHIRKLETTIKTPVQTAVKREDEQEFARLNAENQMFCEDAARILKEALEANPEINDYRIKVSHLESLHAHDAVAITVKGVPGGLTPY